PQRRRRRDGGGPTRLGAGSPIRTREINMTTSLRDRLLGRSSNNVLEPRPATGDTASGTSSGMYGPPREEEAPLSAVEQLKMELHRRLIERLDLEALERISDEQVIVRQIRQAVTELLKGETTPLSQAEREEVIEQIVYEV